MVHLEWTLYQLVDVAFKREQQQNKDAKPKDTFLEASLTSQKQVTQKTS